MLKIGLAFLLILFTFAAFAQKSTACYNVSTFSLYSPQLQISKKIWIYIPKNYHQTTIKYPVLYMTDGQNVFDAATSYAGEWEVDETLNKLNAEIIVVAIEHGGDKRMEELTPFAHAKYGGGKADLFLEYIVNTVKPYVDRNYRTKSNRKNTAIMGSSLGGLFAYYAGLKFPEVFGKIGCFSPAFWFNRKEINNLIADTKSFAPKIYFMCGDQEGDADVIPDMERIVQETMLKEKKTSQIKSLVVAGGEHNEKFWSREFANAYLWLFKT